MQTTSECVAAACWGRSVCACVFVCRAARGGAVCLSAPVSICLPSDALGPRLQGASLSVCARLYLSAEQRIGPAQELWVEALAQRAADAGAAGGRDGIDYVDVSATVQSRGSLAFLRGGNGTPWRLRSVLPNRDQVPYSACQIGPSVPCWFQ
jgi:hypothetical protein